MLLPLMAPVGIAPAGAAEAFTLTVENGELRLRDTEEAQILESPTTISGTNDGGVLKDITFSTPPINFVLEVTNPISTTAEIEAVFTQAGAISGTIDPDGNVSLALRLTVDLEISVSAFNLTFQCRVTPIMVPLRSEAPYESAGVLSTGFSVPAATESDTCPGLARGPVDEALLGGGHSLRLPLSGELTRPAHPGESTTTSLVVDPASSGMGDPVTLTATVAKGTGTTGTDPITGGIEFLDRGQVIGTAEVDPATGKATLVLDDLAAGERRLQARYQGIPEVWASSMSEVVTHRVNATPFLSAEVPSAVRSGGDPVDLSVTVDNTALGGPMEDARVDVVIRRPTGGGTGSLGPSGGVPRITLSRVEGETETPVSLTLAGSQLTGRIGDPAGWDLAPGASRVEELRLQVSGNTAIGRLELTFRLVTVTPGTGVEVLKILAEGSDQIAITKNERVPTTVVAGDEFFGGPAVVPTAARQGGYLNLIALGIERGIFQLYPTGRLEFFLAGQPVAARRSALAANPPYSISLPADHENDTYLVQVPANTPLGTQQVTVRYSGDALLAPSQGSWPIQILPGVGPSYECVWSGVASYYRAFVNIRAAASFASLAPTGGVDVTDMVLDMVTSRTFSGMNIAYSGIGENPTEVSVSLSSGGEIISSHASRVNGTPMESSGSDPDHVISFVDGVGEIELDGRPGEVVPLAIDQITVNATTSAGYRWGIVCLPIGDPVALGHVTVAGTTVEADAATVETGSSVTLTAAALPGGAGAVEFRAGGESIGVVPTIDGTAAHLVDELAPGVHEFTATFRGGVGVPTTTSNPVSVRVATCAAATGEGNEAAVRLMYLEILRRCPDAAGLAFWVERLDAGATTREQITVQLASSLEARRVYVDDAYRQMLGRPAEAAGRNFWAPRLATGRYDVLLGDLAASVEFRGLAGGTDAGVVQRIYERIIGRAAEPAGLTYWTAYMRTHGVSRLVQVLYNLPEPLAATVRNAYQDLIGRTPTSQEVTAGANLLSSTGNRGRLDGLIIATDDFDTRAQGIPELT